MSLSENHWNRATGKTELSRVTACALGQNTLYLDPEPATYWCVTLGTFFNVFLTSGSSSIKWKKNKTILIHKTEMTLWKYYED